MDYLNEAKDLAELGHDAIDRTGQADTGAYQAAIAAALIALVERLDMLIDTDYQDSGQAALMIGSQFKL